MASKLRLTRRTFLRGVSLCGAAVRVGLPPLETMFNSAGTSYAAETTGRQPGDSVAAAIRDAVVTGKPLYERVVTRADLDEIDALPLGGIDFAEFIHKIERDLIHQSLERTGGNKGQAARLLNLKRTTLVEKLKRFREES